MKRRRPETELHSTWDDAFEVGGRYVGAEHGEALAGTGLAVRKDGTVETDQYITASKRPSSRPLWWGAPRLYGFPCSLFVNIFLADVGRKYSIKCKFVFPNQLVNDHSVWRIELDANILGTRNIFAELSFIERSEATNDTNTSRITSFIIFVAHDEVKRRKREDDERASARIVFRALAIIGLVN